MLVLSRKPDLGFVHITVPPSSEPREITIQVVRAVQGNVRLGFQADRDVKILRSEHLAAERPAA